MFNWLVTEKAPNKIPNPPAPDRKLAETLSKKKYNPRYYSLPENLNEEIKEEYQKRALIREIDEIFDLPKIENNIEQTIAEIEQLTDGIPQDNPQDNPQDIPQDIPKYNRSSYNSFHGNEHGGISAYNSFHGNEHGGISAYKRLRQSISSHEDWDSVSSNEETPPFNPEPFQAWGSPIVGKQINDDEHELLISGESTNSETTTEDASSEDRNNSSEDTSNINGIPEDQWHTSPFGNISWDPSWDPLGEFATSAELDNMETQIVVEKPISPVSNKMYRHLTGPEHPEGFLEIYMGPMFSGKSTKAFFKLSSMADQRFRCLYINSVKDVRKTESHDSFVSTHNSSYSQPSPKITCVKTDQLSKISVDEYEYIAIDELQFYPDAYETVVEWVAQGKYIIVASLDGDCYRRKFGSVLDLIPHANQVTKLTAYCDICRDNYRKLTPAPFTARMTSDTTSELVGGKDIYKAMCRDCHDFHLDVTSAIL